MLEQSAFPQLNYLHPMIILQQNGAPLAWSLHVRKALNVIKNRTWQVDWMRLALNHGLLIHQTSPNYRCNFINNLTPEILHYTWCEIDYLLDNIHATKGLHIKVYSYFVLHLVSYSFLLCFNLLFTCILFSLVTLSN